VKVLHSGGIVTEHIEWGSKLPYYVQLKQILVKAIEQGELKPGDLLPTEADLCDRYRVSRTVVRQALGEMVSEGRLYRLRGKGTFVTGQKLSERFLRTTLGFFDDLTAAGNTVRNDVLKCELVDAHDSLAKKLELSPRERVVEIDRLRFVNDVLTASMQSYLPHDLAPHLMDRLNRYNLRDNSLSRFLEGINGVRIYSGHRSVEAVQASEELARLLRMEVGGPLLYIESVECDANGRPVEYSRAWHRGDHAKLEMDVVRRL
jgi:GntR family transcriptional regulator